MSNTHYEDVMNIILETHHGSMDVEDALAEVHQHVKQEPPQHGPQTVIIIGRAECHYKNGTVSKSTMSRMIALLRPDRGVVIMPLDSGIKPIAYITKDANISVPMHNDNSIEVHATTEDGQVLHVKFLSVQYTSGLP